MGVRREVRRTGLLVGEGLAEVMFLRHLKSIYVLRGSGRTVTIKNAKGKGGRQVLDYTVAQRKTAAYDEEAALLDTDTDWDDGQRALAKRYEVVVFEAAPCLEALLLDIARETVPRRTRDCKQAFQKCYGMEAHDPRVYERYFPRTVLEDGRTRVAVLDQLIRYLTG